MLAPVDASRGARRDRRPRRSSTPIRSRRCRSAARTSPARCSARIGHVDPTSLDDYRAQGGYAALRRAFELGGEGVIRELKDSRLMGRGGAAFPTGVKWEAVAHQAARPHYLICNADESEPGTFKDRVVIEGDPYSLIEAMTIAGYATGCEHGYVYLRGEYPQAHAHPRRGARRGAPARLPRRPTCSARASRSTSRSARAAAPTSAARRRRSSTRSRASAASRARSRRSPSSRACSASRRSSTTSRRSSTCSTVVLGERPGLRRDRHRGLERHEAVLPLRQRRAPGRLRGAVRRRR